MARCGLCKDFDQTPGPNQYTCKLEDPRKYHDPASDACINYVFKWDQAFKRWLIS